MSTQTAERFTRFADFYPFYRRAQQPDLSPSAFRWQPAGPGDSRLRPDHPAVAVAAGDACGRLRFRRVGHFVFEKNRPATFQYPLYSLLGDWVMFKDMLTGRVRF